MSEEITEMLRNLLQPIIKDAVSEAMAANAPQVVDENRYTRKQVCDRWNITLPTLSSYVKDGKITPIKIGRRVLFAESEIQRAESDGVGKYKHTYNK
ncbi:MAG: helix-turn-helix domain-containing protein [Prevotella sp.]|jgi:excisionase family DNA binding protein|nr:helix-turn-helix domain-containing protein [Prevotella sp.]MCI1281111.1 helix-turn-helix domain-containing protein [Prevotella sp.]